MLTCIAAKADWFALSLSLGLTVRAAMRAILLRITLMNLSLWVLANLTSRWL